MQNEKDGSGKRKPGSQYLNFFTRTSGSIQQLILFFFGGILTFFWGTGLALGLTESYGITRRDIFPIIVLMIPGILMVIQGIRIGKRNELAKRYNQIFEADRDGTLSMSELKKSSGKEEEQIVKELDLLFRKGYFRDCHFKKEDSSGVVILPGTEKKGGDAFVYVQCSHCGGVTRVPVGTNTVCSYCGSPINLREL